MTDAELEKMLGALSFEAGHDQRVLAARCMAVIRELQQARREIEALRGAWVFLGSLAQDNHKTFSASMIRGQADAALADLDRGAE
jgi:hypothetical protein